MSRFLAVVHQSVECLTAEDLKRPKQIATKPQVITFGPVLPVPGPARTSYAVDLSHTFKVMPDTREPQPCFKVTSKKYTYTLYNRSERVISFEWHPDNAGIWYPHVHVQQRGSVFEGQRSWEKIHIPSGRVSIEQFLWLLFDAFKVPSRKQNWKKILKRNHERFAAHKTW